MLFTLNILVDKMRYPQPDSDQNTRRLSQAQEKLNSLTSLIWSMRLFGLSTRDAENLLLQMLVDIHHLREHEIPAAGSGDNAS